MHMDIQLQIRHLKCLQPLDDPDEPFAWTFFFALDGTNITQNRINSDRMTSTITVTGNSGSHGNLSAGEVSPGRVLHMPPGMGSFATTLRPIRVSFGSLQLQVPGRIGCFLTLLDERATSDHDIEVAHQKVTARVQQRLNEFVQGISLSEVTISAGRLRAERPDLALDDAATEVLQTMVDGFIDALTDEVQDYAEEVVAEESNVIQLIQNYFDGDAPIGSFQYVPDENALIASNLSTSFVGQLRFKPKEWKAVYDVGISVTARLVPGTGEIHPTGAVLSDVIGARGELTTTDLQLCIPKGTTIGWKRHDLAEQCNFDFDYPFADVVWSIEGQDLPAGLAPGTLQLTKTVRYARTDVPPSGIRLASRTEQRTVTVRYERTRTNGVERLSLFNRAEDGQYTLAVGLFMVLPNGARLTVDPESALFDGQSVELDKEFVKAYSRCIAELEKRGHRTKRVRPWDLWGPHSRTGVLDRITEELAIVAQLNGLSPARTAFLAAAAARQLGVAGRRSTPVDR